MIQIVSQMRIGVALLFLLLSWSGPLRAAQQGFPLPPANDWITWPALQATQKGAWQAGAVEQAGQYLQPAQAGHELWFPFEAMQQTSLRLRPVWWRNGEQKLSHRFPYPLVRQPGPDALVVVGGVIFATAPATGRVIAVDAASEKILGYTELGGYLADLVADPAQGKLYVADAQGDRIVVLDAKSRSILMSFPLAGGPWSLAFQNGILYVACREAKRVVSLDTKTGKTLHTAKLPAEPINVELTTKGLVVRFQQLTFNAITGQPALANEQQYHLPPRGPLSADLHPSPAEEFARVRPGELYVDTENGKQWVNVSRITGGAADPDIVKRFGNNPGPIKPVGEWRGAWHETKPGTSVLEYFPPEQIFFLSPSHGRMGVYTQKTHALSAIDIGGYPSDIAGDTGSMFYVADPANDRVVMINPSTLKVEGEYKVPGAPSRLAYVPEIPWQRSGWPTTPVNCLYIFCAATRDIAVFDCAKRAVVAHLKLPAVARTIRYVPHEDTDSMSDIPSERADLILEPRVAVELQPMRLSLANLRQLPPPADIPEAAPRRYTLSYKLADGQTKTFSATNQLLLGIDEKRWIDLSLYADPQRAPAPPLTAKDLPGSIMISVDNGPYYDWAAGIWQTPENRTFLVNESEEFWQYNAPTLQVKPGRHVIRVKANSAYARLQAIKVQSSLAADLEVAVMPEPRSIHAQVPVVSYQGVFYDQEPVLFTMQTTNRSSLPMTAKATYLFKNYMGEAIPSPAPATISLQPGESASQPVSLDTKEMGRFTLTVTLASSEGTVTKVVRFLRLPKLEHPRLLYRPEDIPAIKARIAKYPTLFRRYADWISRMSRKEGGLPDERFLPAGFTPPENIQALSPDKKGSTACAYRNYELGIRILAAQFTANLLKPDDAALKKRMAALLMNGNTDNDDYYFPDQFHYSGSFFPGADSALLDLAPADIRETTPLRQFYLSFNGQMNRLAWTLVNFEEPLTPQKRALMYNIMEMENNTEQYFGAHAGRRGGTWWQSPYSNCNCPGQSFISMFLYLRSMFGEPRLFEKPFFAGYPTFLQYVNPLRDNREVQLNNSQKGPWGEPLRWIMVALSQHPLEEGYYHWDDFVKQLEGPLAGDEAAQVDKLMSLAGRWKDDTPDWYRFVSGASIPLAIALGWYTPGNPTVSQEEMPPTTVFDLEGWVPMRTGWDDKATEVTFISGAREHTIRNRPNDFTINKAGEYLIGTPSTMGDDGNNVGSWANAVVVDDTWRNNPLNQTVTWPYNIATLRDQEYPIINRFSISTWTYLARDIKAVGDKPADGGYGGGLDLHGHSQTAFIREGKLIGYQTWPEVDFVAGDATNTWLPDQVSNIDRQLVFLKPDLVVLYDRVTLGPNGHTTKWMAATGPKLAVSGADFSIQSNAEYLAGRVLLPTSPVLATPEPSGPGWNWKDQRLLEITPAQQSNHVEYLVVMQMGEQAGVLPETQLIKDEQSAGVKLTLDGKNIEVRFNRSGPVGGEAVVSQNETVNRYPFRDVVDDNYHNWKSDPRYQKWMNEPRFDFIIRKEKD